MKDDHLMMLEAMRWKADSLVDLLSKLPDDLPGRIKVEEHLMNAHTSIASAMKACVEASKT